MRVTVSHDIVHDAKAADPVKEFIDAVYALAQAARSAAEQAGRSPASACADDAVAINMNAATIESMRMMNPIR